jgi:hypothetical protein
MSGLGGEVGLQHAKCLQRPVVPNSADLYNPSRISPRATQPDAP